MQILLHDNSSFIKIAIVGSRRRNSPRDKAIVFNLVFKLKELYGDNLVVISGGCRKGADKFAKLACRKYDVKLDEYLPDKVHKSESYHAAVARFYARNYTIAENCQELYAMVSEDRTGGTENTIGYADNLGRRVELI